MSTSTHLENTIPKAATPPQKKEEFAASTQTASTEAASASGMPEPRSYAVSLGANASAVLVAYQRGLVSEFNSTFYWGARSKAAHRQGSVMCLYTDRPSVLS